MAIRGQDVDETGGLAMVLNVGSETYLSTTIFVKYHYEVDETGNNELRNIFIATLPNGMLQAVYNPDARNSIWLVGRQAPTLGEDFRVRISFSRLKEKANWRVQRIQILPNIAFTWDD
jgi:Type II restriction enzyme SfiI